MARMILLAGLTVGFGFGLTSLADLGPPDLGHQQTPSVQVAAR